MAGRSRGSRFSSEDHNDYDGLKLSRAECAYIAGIIDGEGSISLTKTKDSTVTSGFCYHPKITIINTNRNLMEWLAKYLGNVPICDCKKEKLYHSQRYSIQLYANRLRWLVPQIISYSIAKKEELQLILEAMKIAKPGNRIQSTQQLVTIYRKLRDLHTNKGWHSK